MCFQTQVMVLSWSCHSKLEKQPQESQYHDNSWIKVHVALNHCFFKLINNTATNTAISKLCVIDSTMRTNWIMKTGSSASHPNENDFLLASSALPKSLLPTHDTDWNFAVGVNCYDFSVLFYFYRHLHQLESHSLTEYPHKGPHLPATELCVVRLSPASFWSESMRKWATGLHVSESICEVIHTFA